MSLGWPAAHWVFAEGHWIRVGEGIVCDHRHHLPNKLGRQFCAVQHKLSWSDSYTKTNAEVDAFIAIDNRIRCSEF